jgi:demethylmenaquinone methyltransferase/2-methoxy-6-polyprenyl-1,4-benzoquinol methylase
MNIEKITPYRNSPQDKKSQVARMFNNISGKYDFLNHFLSMGIDRTWRRIAINVLKKHNPQLILDVATGTGDLAIEATRLSPVKIFGIDISSEMLEKGKQKIKKRKIQDKIEFLVGDSEQMIFEDNKFDAVTVAFGVRNFHHLENGLKEMLRVLKPGGTLVILEFSQPSNPIMQKLYNFYSSKVTPQIGRLVSKDKAAYSYLYESVQAFPYGKNFDKILRETGFVDIKHRELTFGIVTLYTATK